MAVKVIYTKIVMMNFTRKITLIDIFGLKQNWDDESSLMTDVCKILLVETISNYDRCNI